MLNMIINENNKDNILKGIVKRGFNQTPNELKEKIFNEQLKQKKADESNKNDIINYEKTRLSEVINNLKRMK